MASRRHILERKKGGALVGKAKRGKGTKIMIVSELPQRMLGDGAYDSDPLDARLTKRGIEMIAPNRSNRRVRTQDGRAFRRYRRRWKVERVNAWLQNFRRIVTRWEYKAQNYRAFVQLACICILLRQF